MIRCTTQTQTDSDDRAGSGGDSGENVKTGRCWCTWRQKWSSFETYSHNILFIMSHLHQMSIHLSCTETILVICFRSVIKRQQLWRHPRLMMKWTPAIRIFKKCREFFAVKILDLFIIEYVWEICNMYTLNLCPDSGLSCLVLSSKVLVPMLAQDQGATDFVHLQRNSLHQRKKLTWQFHWTRFKNS